MSDNVRNIYKICREASGMTEILAAELLDISPRQLWRYENGEAEVPIETVRNMSLLYTNGQYLMARHIHDAAGGELIPAVDNVSFQQATLRLINTLRRFSDRHRDCQLLEIAEDGVIDPAEWEEIQAILPELSVVVKAVLEFKIAAPAACVDQEQK